MVTAPAVSRARVLLIYRDRLLRDVVVRLLRGAPVELVGCVEADEFAPELLDDLDPNAVILDHAASGGIGSGGLSRLFLCATHGVLRLIAVGLEDTHMLVVQRQVLVSFDAEQFIASTLGDGKTELAATADPVAGGSRR